VCDDGLVIDLSLMKDIRVDEERRTAVVGGGVTWGEFDQAAQRVGLATTGGVVPATGVAGLTLGGGSGFLARTRGLACDNLLGVDLVTAEGRVTHANEQENPDLFWGVRGGGGNFGVATSFAFRLHPVGAILGGVLVHPMRRARELLRFYGKFVEGAPDELTLFAALGTSPDGVPVAVILAGYFGPLDEGERILRPIREFGPPILDDIKRMSYVDLQGILGPAYPPGARNYWKSGFLADLGEEAVDTMVRHAESVPSKRTQVVLEYLGGAVSRVGERDTAFGIETRVSTWSSRRFGLIPRRTKQTSRGLGVSGMRWSRSHPVAFTSITSGTNATREPNGFERHTTRRNTSGSSASSASTIRRTGSG